MAARDEPFGDVRGVGVTRPGPVNVCQGKDGHDSTTGADMRRKDQGDSSSRRWWLSLVGLLGLVVAVGGIALLLVDVAWLSVVDGRGIDGIHCGAPLRNRGWPTGSACHGAVNRQTAVAVVTALQGVGVIIAVVVVRAQARTPRSTWAR